MADVEYVSEWLCACVTEVRSEYVSVFVAMCLGDYLCLMSECVGMCLRGPE